MDAREVLGVWGLELNSRQATQLVDELLETVRVVPFSVVAQILDVAVARGEKLGYADDEFRELLEFYTTGVPE